MPSRQYKKSSAAQPGHGLYSGLPTSSMAMPNIAPDVEEQMPEPAKPAAFVMSETAQRRSPPLAERRPARPPEAAKLEKLSTTEAVAAAVQQNLSARASLKRKKLYAKEVWPGKAPMPDIDRVLLHYEQ